VIGRLNPFGQVAGVAVILGAVAAVAALGALHGVQGVGVAVVAVVRQEIHILAVMAEGAILGLVVTKHAFAAVHSGMELMLETVVAEMATGNISITGADFLVVAVQADRKVRHGRAASDGRMTLHASHFIIDYVKFMRELHGQNGNREKKSDEGDAKVLFHG